MAKKKITGQSKLAQISAPTTETPTDSDLKLVTRKKRVTPTSFRLTPEDRQRLKRITEDVNGLSPNMKISETMVVKALIFGGEKMKSDKLLNLIRDVIL